MPDIKGELKRWRDSKNAGNEGVLKKEPVIALQKTANDPAVGAQTTPAAPSRPPTLRPRTTAASVSGTRAVQPISPIKVQSKTAPTSVPLVVKTLATKAERKVERPQLAAGVPKEFRPIPRATLRRKDDFKTPEDWVSNGCNMQLNGSAPSGREMDIVIGLDFGTSYTKVAVGFMDKIYPVTWEGTSGASPDFLLASEYSLMKDGRAYLGQHPEAELSELKADLKLPFINPAVSINSVAKASVFLALVLRYVRAWIYRHHAGKIGTASIRWQLNIGAPSNGLETGHLERAYRRLACTAWRLSELEDGDLTAQAEQVAHAWHDGALPSGLNDQTVCPEFIAQLAGYVQSPQRTRGLHALVDVGGGTMDVVTFIVHSIENEDTFPFLVPEVRPLGTQGLTQNRLVGAQLAGDRNAPDELAPVMSAAEFAAETGLDTAHVVERDRMFQGEICRVVQFVFETTRSRRYRLAEAWKTGVRTFFTGGGAQAPLYTEAMHQAKVPVLRGLQLLPLPNHPRLDGFIGTVNDYQRISVACGLAQDAFSLGRIVPARLVDDDKPVVGTVRDRPDRDDLYAR